MCLRKDIGSRCSNQNHRSLVARQEELANALQELKDHEAAVGIGLADEALVKKQRNLLANKVARLQGEMAKVQENYNATSDGVALLQARVADDSLSDDERTKAQQDLTVALETRANGAAAKQRDKVQSTKLSEVLENAGVDKATISEIRSLMLADKKNPHPRSVADYKKSLEVARTNRTKLEDAQEAEVSALYAQAKRENWDNDKATASVESLDAEHGKAMAVAVMKNKKARQAYDSTVEGQNALRALIAKTSNDNYVKKSELKNRLAIGEKTRRDGLSDRAARVMLKDRITEVMKEQGHNPKVALDVLKLKVGKATEIKPTLMDDNDRVSKSLAHMTVAGSEKASANFSKSPEYKAQGEAGLNDYVRRVVLQDPNRMAPKSRKVEDANKKAEIFDKGVPSRHKTFMVGHRSQIQPIYLSQAQKDEIKHKAQSFNMTASSYMNALLTGKSPFAIQNDRSEKVNKEKTRKIREMLEALP